MDTLESAILKFIKDGKEYYIAQMLVKNSSEEMMKIKGSLTTIRDLEILMVNRAVDNQKD